MYNRQLDSDMADTQVTQIGKTMDTVRHASEKQTPLFDWYWTEGGGWGGGGAAGGPGGFSPVSLLFQRSDQLENNNHTNTSVNTTLDVFFFTCLKCDATHLSVYGCDSVPGRMWEAFLCVGGVHVHSRLSVSGCSSAHLAAYAAKHKVTCHHLWYKTPRTNEASLQNYKSGIAFRSRHKFFTYLCWKMLQCSNYISLNHFFLFLNPHTVFTSFSFLSLNIGEVRG